MPFQPLSEQVWGLGDYDAPELQFNGRDVFGIEWLLRPVTGWKTSSVELPVEEFPGDGGAFGVGRRPSRVLTLSGAFRGDPDLLDDAEYRFRAAVERFTSDQILWAGEKVPKQVTVRQSGPCIVTDVTSRARVFSVVMTAADPLKYAAGRAGLQQVATGLLDTTDLPGMTFPLEFPVDFKGTNDGPDGRVDAVNTGTVDVFPVITYTGEVLDPAVRHVGTGQRQGIGYLVPAAEVVTVDHRLRAIRRGSIPLQTRKTPGTEFFRLRPGSNRLLFTAGRYSATALMTASYRPAWS